jgi:2-polyprenyl-3-methyl-5-hydroxy-6-metoxy-1,4-benzoquinol methylase
MLLQNRQAELMDDPNLDPLLHEEALRGLENLNFFSLTGNDIWRRLKKFTVHNPSSTIRVLDLATGGGDIPLMLAKKANRAGLSFEFVGADISPTAIRLANERVKKENISVSFMELNVLEQDIPSGFDIIMTSLFTHHLDPMQVIDLLVKMRVATKQFVLINDLIRSEFNLALVSLATRLLSKSKIVHYDGPASVRAAYTINEMRDMAEQAGLNNYKIYHSFPCRQLLVWEKAR